MFDWLANTLSSSHESSFQMENAYQPSRQGMTNASDRPVGRFRKLIFDDMLKDVVNLDESLLIDADVIRDNATSIITRLFPRQVYRRRGRRGAD